MINQMQVNASAMQRFGRLWANQRLAHAYLLTGPKNCGKTQTALSLAQLVNCEGPAPGPCGECSACRKIASGNHPDVHMLGRDETESIKIEEVRFLLGRAHLMSFEAKTKVFIIRNIETMTTEAANALLKSLEEPAANTLMVLTTSVPESSLETIKSRCHLVKFFPSSIDRMAGILMQEGLNGPEACFLALYSEGNLGRSRKLLEEKILARRRKIFDEMLLNRYNDNFIKELAADPQEAAEALGLLLSFFRDVMLLKGGAGDDRLVNRDRLKETNAFAAKSMEDVGVIINQIVQTKGLLDENLNARMSLNLLKEYIWGN